MADHFQLFTSHYRKFREGLGTPIQISNGKPKYPLDYTLRYSIRALYPAWSLVKANPPVEVFRQKYWAELDKVGSEAFQDLFQKLADSTGEPRLVLMCFERNPADCHRGDFAIWWKRETGLTIPELRIP